MEAGVDIDLDGLITEAAPFDALRQRFGRLNRAGREIVPYGCVIATRSDLRSNYIDPVYGQAIRVTWECLLEIGKTRGRGNKKEVVVDFGLNSFALGARAEALSPRADAPVLLPAHLDLLSQTGPVPAVDPDVSLYLHGAEKQPDSVTVVWRADIDPQKQSSDETRRLLKLVPPRAGESIELPLWAIRRWLKGARSTATIFLADVATSAPPDGQRERFRQHEWRAFRWKGDDDRSQWIDPGALRAGDTVVVPATYGGVDTFGWNPTFEGPSTDLGHKAAEAYAGRRLAIRVAPGLLGDLVPDSALADALAQSESQRWRELRESVASLPLPAEIKRVLSALDSAKAGRVVCYQDLYGSDDEGRPRGVVFLAPFGIKGQTDEEDGCTNTTEDDFSGSMPGFPLSLAQHSADVEKEVAGSAERAGFTAETISDLKVAAFLHDAGKADPRFQAWLHYGDPLGTDVDEAAQIQVLAKSARLLPRGARLVSGLPDHWRHEALSVRMALLTETFSKAHDPELVLWLIGTHHGYGRPFFPHNDPADTAAHAVYSVPGFPKWLPAEHGPQSLGFNWNNAEWPTLFERLKARYGVWELARMEATLRLADHRASEEAARNSEENVS
jgi:CRISPR-associated endonuclease/helicase Cas3